MGGDSNSYSREVWRSSSDTRVSARLTSISHSVHLCGDHSLYEGVTVVCNGCNVKCPRK